MTPADCGGYTPPKAGSNARGRYHELREIDEQLEECEPSGDLPGVSVAAVFDRAERQGTVRKLFLFGGILIGAVAASVFAMSANANTPRDAGSHMGVAFIGMIGGMVGGGLGAILGRLFSKRP